MLKIGLVSDTHGRFDPALPTVLHGVDLILLAGDIGKEEVLDQLSAIAPVHAIAGNNDQTGPLSSLPEQLSLALEGEQILMVHDAKDRRLPGWVEESEPTIVVVGHSHRPTQQSSDGYWLINPGSAGPRRFSLPRTAATLTLDPPHPPTLVFWDLDTSSPWNES